MLLRTLLLAALAATLHGEDNFDAMVTKTDMASVEQVCTLAQWCKDHSRPDHARQYWRLAVKLDPDNEQAHSELGQVRDGDRWVTVVNRPSAPDAPADKEHAGGPAPTAAQVQWNMGVPRDPQPDNDFIDAYIAKRPTITNDSNDMDSAVATMLMDENLPSALPRLCKALDRPDYNDLYGAANVVMGLSKAGRLDTARPLLPHLVKGTTHCTDDDDIAAALFAIGLFKDKRAVPRIIELYDSKSDGVKEACANAAAMVTAMSPPIAKAQLQSWWEKNWNADPQAIFEAQLRSADPHAQIAAAEALFDLRDKAIFPVLVHLLGVEDREVNARALVVIKRMCGLDFSYADANTAEERAKRAKLAEKWWKDNGQTFRFPEPAPDPVAAAAAKAPPAPVDHTHEWVGDLGSVVGNADAQAEATLRAAGLAAVPALVGGLETSAAIIRRRCNEILKVISKQDFGFDAHGAEADRAKAVASWKTWSDAHAPQPPDAGGGN